LKSTNEFIKNNPNILISRADKGTVLLDKNEYVNKMEQILADNDTYQVPKDPSKKIINDLRKLISKWKKNFIDDFTYKKLLTTDSNTSLSRDISLS